MIYTIYLITNTVNGRRYIGFTSNTVEHRLADHIRKAGPHAKVILQRAINKHGPDNFITEAIYQSKDKIHTKNTMEEYFIREYHTHVDERLGGYNMSYGGDGVVGASKLTRHRQGSGHRGKKYGPMTALRRARIGAANAKNKPTEKHKQQIRDALTGTKQSADTVRKHSKEWLVIAPDGVETVIVNLTKFCRDRGLNQGAMAAMGRGASIKHHKGWRCRRLSANLLNQQVFY